jgi:DNA uptake protein ComE-like DNA-binding protein
MHHNFFKEYFTFSLAARRGIWVLLILIIIAFSLPFFYTWLFKNNSKLPDPKEIIEFDKALVVIKDNTKAVPLMSIKSFDPNKLSKEDWIKLGVKPKISDNIEKYIYKGGKFHKQQDLLKIYGFDKAVYNKLSPYMFFTADTTKGISKKIAKSERIKKIGKTEKTQINFIELNSADSITMGKLPGINKTLSLRILKFRNLLGGFYKQEQLLEVYGFKKNIYDSVKCLVKIDSNLIKKINLNQVSEKELAKHPYIGKYKAVEIIKYRKFKNKISNYDELVLNGFFSKEEMNKLKYYLKVD